MGSHRVGQDWSDLAEAAADLLWWSFHNTKRYPTVWRLSLHHFAFTKDLQWYGFCLAKRNPKRIFILMKMGKIRVWWLFCREAYRNSRHPKWWEWHHHAPSLGTTLSISTSSCPSCELCLWASVSYFGSFCAGVSQTCPKVTASSL